ncbi:MAG: hypothetical protein P8012_06455 [Desulfobacterales bacterium]
MAKVEGISKLGFSVKIKAEDQLAGILKYVEDLRRGLNADIGRKDFFEMASSLSAHSSRMLP